MDGLLCKFHNNEVLRAIICRGLPYDKLLEDWYRRYESLIESGNVTGFAETLIREYYI